MEEEEIKHLEELDRSLSKIIDSGALGEKNEDVQTYDMLLRLNKLLPYDRIMVDLLTFMLPFLAVLSLLGRTDREFYKEKVTELLKLQIKVSAEIIRKNLNEENK